MPLSASGAALTVVRHTPPHRLTPPFSLRLHRCPRCSSVHSVKLKAFSKFEDTTSALAAATAICDGKLDKSLRSFLKEAVLKGKEGADKVTLAVSDPKLGGLIKEKLDIKCVYDNTILELMRGIRGQLESLVSGLSTADANAMKLGLSHSLCRYKLKFSPDKVDTMIVRSCHILHTNRAVSVPAESCLGVPALTFLSLTLFSLLTEAIALLDELDKELNTYAMRVREWYGWHFPEMGKIVNDNILYAKVSSSDSSSKRASLPMLFSWFHLPRPDPLHLL